MLEDATVGLKDALLNVGGCSVLKTKNVTTKRLSATQCACTRERKNERTGENFDRFMFKLTFKSPVPTVSFKIFP
jgi:hypothetical protein